MIYNWFIGPQSSGSTNWIPFNPHRKAAAVPRESKRSGEEKNRHENQEQIRTTTYNNQQQQPIHNFETLSSSHTYHLTNLHQQPTLSRIHPGSIINRSYPKKKVRKVLLKKKAVLPEKLVPTTALFLIPFLASPLVRVQVLPSGKVRVLPSNLATFEVTDQSPWNMWRSAVPPDQKPFNYHGTMSNGPLLVINGVVSMTLKTAL